MRFLSALMPREARLFSLFDRHAELIAEGGRANSELVRTYSDEAQRAALIAANVTTRDHLPGRMIFGCCVAISMRTMSGGLRIVKTMG